MCVCACVHVIIIILYYSRMILSIIFSLISYCCTVYKTYIICCVCVRACVRACMRACVCYTYVYQIHVRKCYEGLYSHMRICTYKHMYVFNV